MLMTKYLKSLPEILWGQLKLHPAIHTERMRKTRLLENLVIGFIGLIIIAIVFLFLEPLLEYYNSYSHPSRLRLIIVTTICLLGLGIIYFTAQHMFRISSIAFIVGFTLFLFSIDAPYELIAGRSKFFFFIPIFLSSFLLRPVYSYIASILIVYSIHIFGISVQISQNANNTIVTFFGFLFIALIAERISSQLERTILQNQKTISQLYTLRTYVLEAREHERGNLSRKLHDGPIQDLLGVQIQLGGRDKENAIQIKQVIHKLREICGQLRPPSISSFGLKAAIESHAQTFQQSFPEIEIHLVLSDDQLGLKEFSRLALFRIYEQSMQNITQHAKASKTEIEFYCDEDMIHLSIEDNGTGFEVPEDIYNMQPGKHYGIINCHERALMIGGKFNIYSNAGTGTLTLVKAPLAQNRQEETLDPYLVD